MKKNVIIIGLVVIIIILFYFLLQDGYCRVSPNKSGQVNNIVNTLPSNPEIKNIDNTNNGAVITKSGIKGNVSFTSCAGIAQEGSDPICNKYGGVLSLYIKNKTGVLVKEINSLKDGTFEVELAPGEYTIGHNKLKNEPYSTSEVKVSVMPGSFAKAEISVKVLNQ